MKTPIPVAAIELIPVRNTARVCWQRLSLLLLIAFLVSPCAADELAGRVVGVHDGDTITVLTTDNQTAKIRLAQIDAPEMRQPYGKDAKRQLSELVFGRSVTVEVVGQDQYGRTVGEVFVESVNANRWMVQRGAAWVYRKYMTDASLLVLETKAASARLGLWALQPDQRQPPWEWRKQGPAAKR